MSEISREMLEDMERNNFGPPRQVECSRCDRPTENPPEGCAMISGVTIDPCLLCEDCRVLSVRSLKEWGETGWLRHGGIVSATWEANDTSE